jgi:small GTP-binding protein
MFRRLDTFRGRVVVIGDASVGKTSILNRLIDHQFNLTENSTIGANYQVWTDQVRDTRLELQIWDTAGQEKFRALCPMYFRNAIGAIIVYDVTNRESFNHIDEWIKSYRGAAEPGALIAIVGNKSDASPEVTGEEGREWANSRGMEWFQTSAKTGYGVKESFREFAMALASQKVTQTPAPAHEDPVPSENSCGC